MTGRFSGPDQADITGKRDGLLRPRVGKPGQFEAFLPSPSPQNHAANLMMLGDGSLGCVWFGGTQEGMADISVHFSRLRPGAAGWDETVRLVDDPTRSEQNPILFPVPGGALWLLYTSQKSGNQDTSVVRRRISHDNGLNWSPPDTLIADAGTFIRQPVQILANGTWLLGLFRCRTEPGEKWVGDTDTSIAALSGDHGGSWNRVEIPQSLGCVHMSTVQTSDGGLLALFRSRWADFIHESRSADGGQTWSAPRPTALPNNNSSIQATRLADGRIALAYNHSSAANASERRLSLYDEIDDEDPEHSAVARPPVRERRAFWGAPRAPLVLALSADDGKTWPHRTEIETGDGYCMTNNSMELRNRELSYPSVHQSPDGTLNIAYTYHRQAIKYVQIPLDCLESG